MLADPTTVEFFKTSTLVCAGLGLVLNWGALVRSFKSDDGPEFGPIAGIVLWAVLVPPTLYWWIIGLPQKPLNVFGLLCSTILALLVVAMITLMGWRESKTPYIRRLVPESELNDAVASWKARGAAMVLLLMSWFVLANMEVILARNH